MRCRRASVLLGSALNAELLSFPTRRSSDLIAECLGEFTKTLEARTRGQDMRGQLLGRASAGVVAGLDVDRKSTRLNSSHRTISYAVFCLKKKKGKSCGAATGARPANSPGPG